MGAYKYYNPSTQQWEIVKSKSIIKPDGCLEYTPDDIKDIDDKIDILSGTSGTKEKANKEDLDSHLADSTSYSTYKLNPDSEGIFTELQYKRVDGTLILKSILSGGISPLYTTRTETEYEKDGITVKATRVYTITYDVDGNVVSEVLQ